VPGKLKDCDLATGVDIASFNLPFPAVVESLYKCDLAMAILENKLPHVSFLATSAPKTLRRRHDVKLSFTPCRLPFPTTIGANLLGAKPRRCPWRQRLVTSDEVVNVNVRPAHWTTHRLPLWLQLWNAEPLHGLLPIELAIPAFERALIPCALLEAMEAQVMATT